MRLTLIGDAMEYMQTTRVFNEVIYSPTGIANWLRCVYNGKCKEPKLLTTGVI